MQTNLNNIETNKQNWKDRFDEYEELMNKEKAAIENKDNCLKPWDNLSTTKLMKY